MNFYDKVKDTFSTLSLVEQSERSIYIMDLGKKLKITENIVDMQYLIKDCSSAAYIKIYIDDKIRIEVDSLSMFVRGLLYLLKKCFDGELISDIKDFEIDAFMKATGLEMHVTSQRMIGFGGALKEIKKAMYFAQQIKENSHGKEN
jgi:sulfur transfer protein SufE